MSEPVCSDCRWTNVGVRNSQGSSFSAVERWLCVGCAVRQWERAERANRTLKATVLRLVMERDNATDAVAALCQRVTEAEAEQRIAKNALTMCVGNIMSGRR